MSAKKDAKEDEMGTDFFSFRETDSARLDDSLESLAHAAIGAAIEVHRVLGPGLPELVYRNAFSHELSIRYIPHQIEAPVPVVYKGQRVGEGRVDLLIDGRLVIELKVVEQLAEIHKAQVIAYLAALRLQLGLLLNFHVSLMADGIRRVIRSAS